MKKSHPAGILLTLLAMLAMVVTLSMFGCGHESGHYAAEAETEAPAKVEEATPAVDDALEAGPAMVALLAGADRMDGAEDHIISKCTGCALAMDGEKEFVLKVDDYSMHFCSDTCKGNVAENLEESVMALEEAVMAMNLPAGE